MALSYVSSQVALLSDAAVDRTITQELLPVRYALTVDPFGLVAHVLANRAGCTPEISGALALLESPERVRSNLRERPFDQLLGRYATAWPGGGRVDRNGWSRVQPGGG
jgi:hypothetical protein